ncbi:MAG: hypothetical protein V4591_06070 [Bdellovibrionota bacterium]
MKTFLSHCKVFTAVVFLGATLNSWATQKTHVLIVADILLILM